MRLSRLPICIAIAASICLAACQAEDPISVYRDGGAADGSPNVPEQPEDCPTVDPTTNILSVQVPTISDQPTTYSASQASQPVRGKASGAASVIARVDERYSSAGSVDGDGSFCVEAPLTANAENLVEIIPISPHGCWGAPYTTTVKHSTPVSSQVPATVTNVAQYKTVTAEDIADGTNATAMTDGNEDTSAVISYMTGDATVVLVDLGATYRVSQVAVMWAAGEHDEWATEFKVMLSDQADPGEPDPVYNQSNWTTVMAEDYATGSTEGFGTQRESFSARDARWAALLLYEDNESLDIDLHEDFRVAEFQVLSVVQSSVGSTDTCP